MEAELNCRELISWYNSATPVEREQESNLFFDWFCSDASLSARGRSLVKKAEAVVEATTRFDPCQAYFFFKNNCPMSGSTYDDIRFAKLDGGEVLYTISNDHRGPGTWQVWGAKEGESRFDILVSGSWFDILSWFKGDEHLKAKEERKEKARRDAEAARKAKRDADIEDLKLKISESLEHIRVCDPKDCAAIGWSIGSMRTRLNAMLNNQ